MRVYHLHCCLFAKQIQLLLISYILQLNVVEQLDKRLRWPEHVPGGRQASSSPERVGVACESFRKGHLSHELHYTVTHQLGLGMSHSSPSRTLNFGVTRAKSGKKSSVHEISLESVQSHRA